MRIWLARLVLCSFLFAATELHQVLRLPALLLHYIEHKADAPSLSFLNYVTQHYSSAHIHHPGEEKEHKQLPFKDHHCLEVHIAVVVLPTIQAITLPSRKAEQIVGERNFIPPYALVNQAFCGDVWNPPRA